MADPLVGIFDSGVGGLTVLRAIRAEMPGLPLLYFADQARVPYGPRPVEEVRKFADQITRFLLSQGASLIVVACNTASAAALKTLRSTYPDIPFVGMEPALKPAGEHTRSGVVGVLATPATFQSDLYASVVERFSQGVTVLENTCPGLVQEIEAGRAEGNKTRQIIRKALEPMLVKGIDTIVLGCTHYPFALRVIQEIAGPDVRIIDPAPAVARQVARVARDLAQTSQIFAQTGAGSVRYFTSGEPSRLESLLREYGVEAGPVQPILIDSMGENFCSS